MRYIDRLINKILSFFELGGRRTAQTVCVRDAASGGAVRRGLLRLQQGHDKGGWHEAAAASHSKQGEIGTKEKG